MANTKLKLNQIQQDGASTNDVITWNGSAWAPATNGTGTVTSVAATQPAAGLTISGSPITTSGTLTFALANDLAGLEGLSSTGLAVRTGDGTWTTRSIAYASGEGMPFTVNISDATGVSGNPTIQIVNTPNTFKGAVKAATTADITLSGAQTIDGVSVVSGDRVLVKNQSSSINNGIYKVQSGSWLRSSDAGTDLGLANGTLVYVANGTTNAATYWKQDTPNPTVGSSNIVYSQVFASSADGNGIYSGSGNISSAAVATVGSGSTFAISYNNGTANALRVEDNSGVELESDDGTNTFQVLDSAISATANSGSGGLLTLNDTSASIGTSSTGVYIDTTAISLTTDAAKIYGDSTSTVGELHFQEATTNGVNYIGFKAPTTLSGNSTYTLPSSSSDGLMINSSSTLSWGTATNSHLSSGVGGIYKGSGIIPSGTSAKLTTSGSFEVTYSNTSTAFVADDTTSGAALQSRTNAHSIYVDDTQVGLSAPHTLLNSFASNAQELRFEEPAGINYTAFKAQNQSVDITYTLPAAAPASNGYVLSSTTGGTLSWVANGGADGNGIYTGSGTIASNAVATLTSGASFTIDFNGGNNAMWINDSTGAILIYDKTANCGVGMDNAGIGLYSGSDSFVLDESSGGAALNTDLRIYNGKLLLDSVSTPSQFTSNQNNYSLSATAAVLRVSTDASRNLTGIANSGTMQDGRVLTIVNVGSNNIVLTTEDTNSTAANRFALGESNATLKASESLTVWYDTSTDRWRPISYQATTGGATNLAFSGSSSPVTLTSSTGTDVTFTAGTGITLSATGTDLTINSTATGDVLQNGNSFGAAMVIGTNDNNSLSFETNGVTRMSITSGASTGGAITITNVNANTNTVQDVLTISANSSGTPLANYGTGILFQAKSDTVDNRDIARISSYWTQPTDASREGALSFQLGDNAGALAEVMKLDRTTSSGILSIGSTTPVTISNAGITADANYTIAAGSNNLLLNSTGTGITWIGTNSGGSEIGITSLGNNSNSANGITIGLSTSGTNSTYSQTTGTRNYLNFAYNFSPTSGTAVHNQLAFTGTFNQTGGANGITRSINIAPTVTAVADYRALEIAANGTNVKGVYQTGSTTTNNFVGRTSFGTTSSPHASAAIDVVSTTTGVGLPTMTSTQRDAISSPRDGLLVYNSTDNAVSARVNGSWTNLGSGSSGFPTYSYNSQTGTTYTLVAGDAGDMVRASNASAITITVPANSSVAFAVGTMIYVEQTGAGAVTVSPAGGVTILSTARTTPSQYTVIQLYKIDTDTWNVIGGTI